MLLLVNSELTGFSETSSEVQSSISDCENEIVEAQRRKDLFEPASNDIIGDRLSELEELSKSLYYPDDIQPLHDMRIAAKRLR